MKTFLCMTTLACCLMFTQYGNAQNNVAPNANAPAAAQKAPANTAAKPAQGQMQDQNNRQMQDQRQMQGQNQGQYRGQNQGQANAGCPQDHACGDQEVGECWCLMVHYEPRCYTTQRCVEEQIPCTKKCWRKVPQCYEVQKCKMVPEYYTETCTKYVDECYEVPDCKTVKKMVCDEHVEYCPSYYWKHICENPSCPEKCNKR